MQRAVRRVGPGDPGQRPDRRRWPCSCCSSPTSARSTRWPGGRDRRVLRAAGRADAAARAAGDRGPARFLAATALRRVRPGARRRRSGPGVWRRIGDRVLHRPVPALVVTVIFFGAGALGPARLQGRLQHDDVLQEADGQRGWLPGDAEVVPGRAAVPDDGAGGARGRSRSRPADVAAARRRLARRARRRHGDPDGQYARATGGSPSSTSCSKGDPNDSSSLDIVPKLRDSGRRTSRRA